MPETYLFLVSSILVFLFFIITVEHLKDIKMDLDRALWVDGIFQLAPLISYKEARPGKALSSNDKDSFEITFSGLEPHSDKQQLPLRRHRIFGQGPFSAFGSPSGSIPPQFCSFPADG